MSRSPSPASSLDFVDSDDSGSDEVYTPVRRRAPATKKRGAVKRNGGAAAPVAPLKINLSALARAQAVTAAHPADGEIDEDEAMDDGGELLDGLMGGGRGVDLSGLELKVDHAARPLWVDEHGNMYALPPYSPCHDLSRLGWRSSLIVQVSSKHLLLLRNRRRSFSSQSPSLSHGELALRSFNLAVITTPCCKRLPLLLPAQRCTAPPGRAPEVGLEAEGEGEGEGEREGQSVLRADRSAPPLSTSTKLPSRHCTPPCPSVSRRTTSSRSSRVYPRSPCRNA